eukprot:scaffold12458_cov132-Isochrysis_galbana.AAC.1
MRPGPATRGGKFPATAPLGIRAPLLNDLLERLKLLGPSAPHPLLDRLDKLPGDLLPAHAAGHLDDDGLGEAAADGLEEARRELGSGPLFTLELQQRELQSYSVRVQADGVHLKLRVRRARPPRPHAENTG